MRALRHFSQIDAQLFFWITGYAEGSPGLFPRRFASSSGGKSGSKGWGSDSGGGGGGSKKDRLVEKVKELQRQGDRYKQAWYEYCRQKGTSNYDPNRHEEDDLQEFLDQGPEAFAVASTERQEGCNDEDLVQKVKDWQRKGKGHKEAWYSFCRRNGSDKYDPSRHDAETLRDFIRGIESGDIQPKDDDGYGGSSGGGGSWGGGGAGGWGGYGGWGMPWMAPMKGGGKGEWDMMMNMMYGGGAGYGGAGGSSGSDGEGKEGKPGDWICSGCGNVNFSRREDCNKCGASGKGAKRLGMKQGDWICPTCGDLVFASKPMCTMCGNTRPEEGDSSNATSKRYSPY